MCDRMGRAAREEVKRWDWGAATAHLLLVQYPMAVLAAKAVYGAKLGRPMFGGDDRKAERTDGAPALDPAVPRTTAAL